MPKTLVIPDTHEELDKLLALAPYIEQADHVVHLGDWFDSFRPYDDRRVRAICEYVCAKAEDPKWTLLVGNHCTSYFFRHPDFRCSGYDIRKQVIIDNDLPEGVRRKFKLCTRVGKFLLSHAGFTKGNLAIADNQQEALDAAHAGKFHSIFNIGSARGGRAASGGCTWLDWRYEFNSLEQAQIVGHTVDKTVRVRVHEPSGALSYCLDSQLEHVMLIHDESEVEIVTL